MSTYICNTPVVLFIFNRPDKTQLSFDAIKKAKPKTLIIISDGPRKNITNEQDLVFKSRDIVSSVDWECNVIKQYSDINLGCLRRVVTGINYTFSLFERAIFIEDDCVPTLNFFKFMEWGLNAFQHNREIGMISGSNLVSNIAPINYINGFSNFINIWGWSCWKRTWDIHNPYISISETNSTIFKILNPKIYSFWQRLYWRELLKFTLFKGSTWDFQLQFTFFKNNLLSVYPKYNLIDNVGFDFNSTHTSMETPRYVRENQAKDVKQFFDSPIDYSLKYNFQRDNLCAKTIWHYNRTSTLKLLIKNIFRFI